MTRGGALATERGAAPLGTRPAFPQKRPPHVSDQPCKDQRIPDLNAAKTGRADGAAQSRGVTVAPTPAEARAVRAAAAKSSAKTADAPSLTGELASRLNPFGTGTGR